MNSIMNFLEYLEENQVVIFSFIYGIALGVLIMDIVIIGCM